MSDPRFRLLAIGPEVPPGFETRPALAARDLRRGTFALFAQSLAEAEAAIFPFGARLVGLLLTRGAAFLWEKRRPGIYHLALPDHLWPSLPTLLFPQLQLLEELVALGDLEQKQTLDLARATDDRARLVREFAALRESLLQEIGERRTAERALRQAHDELEARVIERTAELGAANASLQGQIAERRRAEVSLKSTASDLARSNAELEQFAYVASHDLQEPLRTVASFVQLLELRYRGRLDAEADTFIQFAVSGATRMQALIRDLLAFSRVGSHGEAFMPTDCSLLLKEVLGTLQVAIHESGATVSVGPLPTIPGSASQLSRLFQNLIGNAIKFRGESAPKIQISALEGPDVWQFSVADNGLGIEARYFERIFMIFQRLHTRERYEGTGIGLAVCRKIVERHGGRIWVESAAGKGSTFHFTLPKPALGGG